MSQFPRALPHGEIEQLFPDVFLVRGTYRSSALIQFTRSMVILREGNALTIVNSIRLSDAGERQLLSLGEVKNLVKIGGHHGIDDPYYQHRFDPTFFAPLPAQAKAERLVDGGPGPISTSTAFVFARSPDEAALLVKQSGGNLLVTCDSLQNWTDTRYGTLAGSIAVRAMGFLTPAKIGPIWLKKVTEGQPSRLWPDFERLLALDFRHLISGHGTLLRDEAKQAVQRSCEKTLGPR